MKVIICPGVHSPQLTDSFIQHLNLDASLLIFPTVKYPAYSAWHVYHWVKQQNIKEETIWISFSAGVVAAMGATIALQSQGVIIKALIAIDGWGVPLMGNFPVYRLSHDYFTHWSSAILGQGKNSFYCDPAVDHLDLWQFPHQAWGWQINDCNFKICCTAVDYLHQIINQVLTPIGKSND